MGYRDIFLSVAYQMSVKSGFLPVLCMTSRLSGFAREWGGGSVSCYQEESRCRKQWTPTVAINTLSLACYCTLLARVFPVLWRHRTSSMWDVWKLPPTLLNVTLCLAASSERRFCFWNTPGVGWVNFFRWEPVPYLSEYVCQIRLRSDGRVEKKGGGTDRQTKGHCSFI